MFVGRFWLKSVVFLQPRSSVGLSRAGRTRCLQEENLSVRFLQIPALVQTENGKT